MLRPTLLLLAALTQVLPAYATTATDPAVRAVIDKARVDLKAGKIVDAVDALRKATKSDKTSSEAHTLLASVFFTLYKQSDTHVAFDYRRQAHAHAIDALLIDLNDKDALDVKDALDGTFDQKHYIARPEVMAVADAGDALYDAGQCVSALKKYDEVVRLDPRYADVHVNIGQCHEKLGDAANAEKAYRKAVAIDRNYDGAWLSLYQLLHKQKRDKEADAAAFAAVLARPANKEAWTDVLSGFFRDGAKVDGFNFKPKASYSVKHKKILVDDGLSPADKAAWTAVAEAQQAANDPAYGHRPFAVLLATWDSALRAIAQIDKATPVSDRNLRQMLSFQQAGQLKAALFALHFREDYRDDYEAWKKAEPEGMRRFVDAFHTGL